jgi:L-ribulokinase
MRYAIGVDFGTESGRAALFEIGTGRQVTTAVYPYQHGVIDELLPVAGTQVRLDSDWALQDPEDYLRTFQVTIPAVLRESGVDPGDIVGLGIDFTACTMLPTLADGTPLCQLPEFRSDPHAWVKLWKHHAAQPEADRINAVARTRSEQWLPRYGGKISSEWFFAKTLQILAEAPRIYGAADRLIEAADWVVWQLTDVETRNACTAGYKAMWSKRDGFPNDAFFAALDPRLEHVVDEKMSRPPRALGDRAGELSARAAAWTGLRPGTPVAIANVDAHVSVPAVGVTGPGTMVSIMGTSICDMVLGDVERRVEGMCGVVEDGILPGLFGFEAGQSGVGDIFAWFTENAVPGAFEEDARHRGVDLHALLEDRAASLAPGESGLLAIDWWNGNRSVLVDVDLSGMLLGATLATRPHEIYRALIEATAFGMRVIIDGFESNGVAVNDIVACGGLPDRNRLLMQIYADVTGRRISVGAASQTPALGSAMFGAVAAGRAAGGYDSIFEAADEMGHLRDEVWTPNPRRLATYDNLYREYLELHDYFGRGTNDVMKRLKALRAATLAPGGSAT